MEAAEAVEREALVVEEVTSQRDLTVVMRLVAASIVVVHRKVLRLCDQEEVEGEHSKQLRHRLFVVSSYKEDKSESVQQAQRLLRWRFRPQLLSIIRRKRKTAAKRLMEFEEILLLLLLRLRSRDSTVVPRLEMEGYEWWIQEELEWWETAEMGSLVLKETAEEEKLKIQEELETEEEEKEAMEKTEEEMLN